MAAFPWVFPDFLAVDRGFSVSLGDGMGGRSDRAWFVGARTKANGGDLVTGNEGIAGAGDGADVCLPRLVKPSPGRVLELRSGQHASTALQRSRRADVVDREILALLPASWSEQNNNADRWGHEQALRGQAGSEPNNRLPRAPGRLGLWSPRTRPGRTADRLPRAWRPRSSVPGAAWTAQRQLDTCAPFGLKTRCLHACDMAMVPTPFVREKVANPAAASRDASRPRRRAARDRAAAQPKDENASRIPHLQPAKTYPPLRSSNPPERPKLSHNYSTIRPA